MGAPPVAGEATWASGSGRQTTMAFQCQGECRAPQQVWEVTKRDALCTNWLSGHPDKELTLDQCFLHKLSWSRVSSLNSWYLTSLVNLSFCSLETTLFFVKDKLLFWPLGVRFFVFWKFVSFLGLTSTLVSPLVYIIPKILQFARWELA